MNIRIGDKIVEAQQDKNGRPVIKATAERIERENGRVDVVIHVPCFKIAGKKKKE